MSKIVEDIVDDIINEINEVQIHGNHKLYLYEMRPILEKHIAKIERPEGKWLITWHKSLSGTWNNYYEYHCSECSHFSRESEYLRYSRPRFCPKCGAKMVDEVRLEDKVGG